MLVRDSRMRLFRNHASRGRNISFENDGLRCRLRFYKLYNLRRVNYIILKVKTAVAKNKKRPPIRGSLPVWRSLPEIPESVARYHATRGRAMPFEDDG